MLSANGTSNLGNELKPKPKQCLVVGILALFPNLHLRHLPPKDDSGDSARHRSSSRPRPPRPRPRSRASLDPTNTPTVSTVAPTGDSIKLLASLRQHSHAAEQALYAQLTTTPVGVLNDVRRTFMIVTKGTGCLARVGGELAGVAAVGVDARSAERQEQLCVIVVSHGACAHPNLSLTLPSIHYHSLL